MNESGRKLVEQIHRDVVEQGHVSPPPNELYAAGEISTSVLRDLERLFQLRSAVVHGFSVPAVEPGDVRFLVDTARRLLTHSQPAKQPA
jgi:hypothetical protein